jgi:hypothetical protein
LNLRARVLSLFAFYIVFYATTLALDRPPLNLAVDGVRKPLTRL